RLYSSLVLLAVLGGGAAYAPAERNDTTEQQKIEAMISAVRELKDATFIRNGTEYDCQAAADHLQMKWSSAKAKIKTAHEFIERIGSVSSQSGKFYVIRFKDGKEVKSVDFLREQLDRLEGTGG